MQLQSTLVIADTHGGRFKVRNSGVRETNFFCLYTNEIMCNYGNIKFLTWPHEPEKGAAASRTFSCLHRIEE